MTGGGWISVIWLSVTLAVMLGGLRGHQLGWRKGLVLALVWLAIFLVAGGIAVYLDRQQQPDEAAPPSASASPILT